MLYLPGLIRVTVFYLSFRVGPCLLPRVVAERGMVARRNAVIDKMLEGVGMVWV